MGQSAEHIKKCGLPAPRRAHDGNELPFFYAEGNTTKRWHIHFANPVGFAQFSGFNEGRHPLKTISQEEPRAMGREL